MATPHLMQLIEQEFLDPAKSEKSMTKGLSIEKKIEFLESLTGKVSNRRSRRWLNDRLLMELVPRLNADEIRGLFTPPPWGDDVPPSTFSMTDAAEWEKFRSIDMDKQDKIIDNINSSSSKKRGHVDPDKEAALNAWRRIGCSTRDALRRSFLVDLIEGYEECIRSFLEASKDDGDVLVLRVQDPFHRLLLHGVCEFYNLASVTEPEAVGCEAVKKTTIQKKKGAVELPSITLSSSECPRKDLGRFNFNGSFKCR